ncbi:MAG: ATP-binding cassette domain-containing protein, partial [Akkermansiaceae bacterium]
GRKRVSLTLGEVRTYRQPQIEIGSSPKRDMCIPVLGIQPTHLRLTYEGGRWFVQDLGGGATLRKHAIGQQSAELSSGDSIDVGAESIFVTFAGDQMILTRLRKGFALECQNVKFTVKDRDSGQPRDLLDNISLSILPGELVGLLGPSGSGKTTLLNVLAGVNNATSGAVCYDGDQVMKGDTRMTSHVGYVPQDDILYPELTVAESLYYSTRFRVHSRVPDAQIKSKIVKVCELLGLNATIRDTPIGSPEKKTLSGGQRKRVNLAMELITDPLILFLDEPTSGLSSRDTRIVVEALRELASTMCIAIIVTIHQPALRVYELFDKVVFLKDGKMSYFGGASPQSMQYFQQRTRIKVEGPDDVMEELEDRSAEQLTAEYHQTPLAQKFVAERSHLLANINESGIGVPEGRTPLHWLNQTYQYSKRYATCRIRDWQAILIQLAQGPLIGILMAIAFSKSSSPTTPLFLMVFVALWFGTNNTSRELVSERTLYRREKRGGASDIAMLLSKFGFNAVVTGVQCFLLLLITKLALDLELSFVLGFLVLWLTSITGILVGMLISAVAKTEVAAIVITPLVLIPFILFGGVIVRYDDTNGFAKFLMNCTPSRWGYEAAVHLEEEEARSYSSQQYPAQTPLFDQYLLKHEFSEKSFDDHQNRRYFRSFYCVLVMSLVSAVIAVLIWWKVSQL